MKHGYLLILFSLLALMLSVSATVAQTSGTLVIWDNWTQDSEQALIDQLDQQFEAAHPGVIVQRQAHSSADLASMLPNALTQMDAPDIAMITQSQLPALVNAGLLLPLNDYSDKYGWPDRSDATLQAHNSIDGKLYGMSVTAEMVAMFYNKAIFSQLSLSIPATWDDLEADLLSIKEAGITPITFGNADSTAGIATFGALAYAYSDIQDINNLISHSPGAAFLTEGNLEAAQNFTDWLDKGYFSPNFATMDNEAALTEFTSGKSALWLTSSDNSTAISAAIGSEQVGFFLLPSPIGAAVTPTVGGLGFAYAIRATSPNADLAAQYIDLMTNPAVANALLGIGVLPAITVDPSTVPTNTLSADLMNAWEALNKADGVGPHLDIVLAGIAEQIQSLAAHRLDSEGFVNAVQQDYESGR